MDVKLPDQMLSCLNFVNGQFQKGSGEKISVVTPYFGKEIAEFYSSTIQDLNNATETALIAQRSWSEASYKERSKILYDFRQILLRDFNEISQIKSLESGKCLEEGKAGLLKGIEVLEFALSIQNLDLGGKMQVSRGVTCEFRREPLGVVASITPFNFPAMVPMWTIPIALVLGNAYIWKPSEKTPLTSQLIARSLKEAGLPDGLFQVLLGKKETAQLICSHPNISAISFVGSTPVAESIYQAGSQNKKRVLALGGAKNHIVLLPDANPELAGVGISDSFTGCAGQRCMAASVLLAVGSVDAHIAEIKKRAESLVLGKNMGAIISRAQVEFLNAAIDRAQKNGAKIILDERKTTAPTPGGFWIGPTIIDEVKPDHEVAKVELFGPVLSIIRCPDITAAMKIENQNPYGNACSVFTQNGALAEKVIGLAKSGMVGVNVGVPVPREPFSFGGINHSRMGHGDITGLQGIDFWSQLKKVTVKWEKQLQTNWMS